MVDFHIYSFAWFVLPNRWLLNKCLNTHRKSVESQGPFLCLILRTTSLCSHIFLVLRDHGVYMFLVCITNNAFIVRMQETLAFGNVTYKVVINKV